MAYNETTVRTRFQQEEARVLNLQQTIESYYQNPERCVHNSYSQMLIDQLDIGFASVIRDGRDIHRITRDLVISVNHFAGGRQINIVFEHGSPIRLELTDRELVSYYTDYIELRYIMSGYLCVELEGRKIRFEKGDICFINSMACRREIITESDCLLLNININKNMFSEAFLNSIGLDALKKYLRMNIIQRSERQHCLRFTPLPGPYTDRVNEYCLAIVQEITGSRPGYQEISRGYLIRLMDHLTNNYEYNFDRRDSRIYAEKLFESITEYMKTHLDTVVIEDLVKNFHFQSNYFNNLIKKNTGMTYSHYLIFLRIERAKQLLYSTQLSVEEVMWIVGYNNKGFFYRKFNELTGMSPSQYRREGAHTAGADGDA